MTDPASVPEPDPLTPAERARVLLATWHALGHGAGLAQEEVRVLWELATAAIEAAERSEREACAATADGVRHHVYWGDEGHAALSRAAVAIRARGGEG